VVTVATGTNSATGQRQRIVSSYRPTVDSTSIGTVERRTSGPSLGHLMLQPRFTEIPIVGTVRKAEAGAAVADRLRKHKISRTTLYLGSSRSSGVGVEALHSLRELERAPLRLKRVYAENALEMTAIKDGLSRKPRRAPRGGRSSRS